MLLLCRWQDKWSKRKKCWNLPKSLGIEDYEWKKAVDRINCQRKMSDLYSNIVIIGLDKLNTIATMYSVWKKEALSLPFNFSIKLLRPYIIEAGFYCFVDCKGFTYLRMVSQKWLDIPLREYFSASHLSWAKLGTLIEPAKGNRTRF